jgi:hypothetical protein
LFMSETERLLSTIEQWFRIDDDGSRPSRVTPCPHAAGHARQALKGPSGDEDFAASCAAHPGSLRGLARAGVRARPSYCSATRRPPETRTRLPLVPGRHRRVASVRRSRTTACRAFASHRPGVNPTGTPQAGEATHLPAGKVRAPSRRRRATGLQPPAVGAQQQLLDRYRARPAVLATRQAGLRPRADRCWLPRHRRKQDRGPTARRRPAGWSKAARRARSGGRRRGAAQR